MTAEVRDVSDIDSIDSNYVLEIPETEIDSGSVEVGEIYKMGLFNGNGEVKTNGRRSNSNRSRPQKSNLDGEAIGIREGDEYQLTVDSIGDEGDGIGHIEDFVVIMKGANEVSEEYTVEIQRVMENFAIAENV